MGQYFLMSFRFHKKSAEDFGLVQSAVKDVAVNLNDNTLWEKCCLYDFGWGKENGFYKIPLPEFNKLLDIVLTSDNKEDKYGAAAIILDTYSDMLLEKCEELIFNCPDVRKLKEFISIFNLNDPINKSPVRGKSSDEILNDYRRWKMIAEYIKRKNV